MMEVGLGCRKDSTDSIIRSSEIKMDPYSLIVKASSLIHNGNFESEDHNSWNLGPFDKSASQGAVLAGVNSSRAGVLKFDLYD